MRERHFKALKRLLVVYVLKNQRIVYLYRNYSLWVSGFDNPGCLPFFKRKQFLPENCGKKAGIPWTVLITWFHDTARPSLIKDALYCGGIEKGLIAGKKKVVRRI